LIGSVAMLLAILGTYFATGTFDILASAAARPFADCPHSRALLLTSLAFWGFFLRALPSKFRSFPFHPGCPTPTPRPHCRQRDSGRRPAQAGWAHGFMRIIIPLYPLAAAYWSDWAVALGVIAIVDGALVCIAQSDLKRLIAYSSVSPIWATS
jgi:NADH-quinone oxidoreductase subunit M